MATRRPSASAPASSGGRAFALAVDAYHRADYSQALEYLTLDSPRSSPERVAVELLRARIARVRSDFPEMQRAAAYAKTHADRGRDRLFATALYGVAARRLGDERTGERILRTVRENIQPARAESAAAAYLLGLEAWRARDYAEAERIVALFTRGRVASLELMQLQGWIDVRRERYAAAGASFVRSLELIRAAPVLDRREFGSVLFAIALTACELVDLKLVRFVAREIEAFAWPTEMWRDHFRALTYLRFCRLLEGDVAGAWLAARAAIAVAREPAFSAMAELAAVEMAQMVGDEGAVTIGLEQAWAQLSKAEWGDLTAEGRMALSDFCLQATEVMAPRARHALVMLRSLRAKRAAQDALDEHDRRGIAYEKWARARIAEMAGHRDESLELYGETYDLFRDVGYLFRAALVGLDARRLSRESVWLEAHQKLLARAPRARLPGDRVATKAKLPHLTPAQLRVLCRVLEGKSVKATAVELECSPFTVTNHTRKLFVAFDAHSRDELKERCAAISLSARSLRAAGVP